MNVHFIVRVGNQIIFVIDKKTLTTVKQFTKTENCSREVWVVERIPGTARVQIG